MLFNQIQIFDFLLSTCRAHEATRSVVEHGINQLKSRFHVLDSEIRLDPKKTCKIILACALLHNICKLRNIALSSNGQDEVVPDCDDKEALRGKLWNRNFASMHLSLPDGDELSAILNVFIII